MLEKFIEKLSICNKKKNDKRMPDGRELIRIDWDKPDKTFRK